MERLLQLLALTEEERGFVRAAVGADPGKAFWLVLADFLEERDEIDAAKAVRKRSALPGGLQEWSFSAMAWRLMDDGERRFRHFGGMVCALSPARAVHRCFAACQRAYPPEQGWRDHHVVIDSPAYVDPDEIDLREADPGNSIGGNP